MVEASCCTQPVLECTIMVYGTCCLHAKYRFIPSTCMQSGFCCVHMHAWPCCTLRLLFPIALPWLISAVHCLHMFTCRMAASFCSRAATCQVV